MSPHAPLPEGEEPPPRGVKVMAVIRWLLLGTMALAALFTWTHGRAHTAPTAPAEASAAAATAPHTRYHCPMHPQVVTDAPGTCPICGMTLTPITESEEPAKPSSVPGTLALDLPQDRLQQLGVRMDVARREPLSSVVEAFGRITADESKITRIHARVAGYVEQLFVATVGAKVKKGDPLAAIYSDELLRLQQELLQAKRWGGDTLGPVRERLRLLGISDVQLQEIETKGAPLRTLTLRSPASGFVSALGIAQGDRIDPDRELFAISDLSHVWLIADLSERDVGRVSEGQQARITLDAYPGQTFTGRVDDVYPALDTQTRTLPVRVVFSNRDGKLKPGLYGHASFEAARSTGITVAAEALVDTGEHRYVYVETRPGHYEPRPVTVGARSGERVQITQGVAEGERVAASGNFFIDAESRLRASVASAPGATSAAPPPPGSGPDCETDFDAKAAPAKYGQCKACERIHRGMGSMEQDCKNAIARPWRTP